MLLDKNIYEEKPDKSFKNVRTVQKDGLVLWLCGFQSKPIETGWKCINCEWSSQEKLAELNMQE